MIRRTNLVKTLIGAAALVMAMIGANVAHASAASVVRTMPASSAARQSNITPYTYGCAWYVVASKTSTAVAGYSLTTQVSVYKTSTGSSCGQVEGRSYLTVNANMAGGKLYEKLIINGTTYAAPAVSFGSSSVQQTYSSTEGPLSGSCSVTSSVGDFTLSTGTTSQVSVQC